LFKQQRIRENRDARRKRIKDEHKFVMNMVSLFLEGIEPSSIEEFIIDSGHVSNNNYYISSVKVCFS